VKIAGLDALLLEGLSSATCPVEPENSAASADNDHRADGRKVHFFCDDSILATGHC
jgi:hypothetical protein